MRVPRNQRSVQAAESGLREGKYYPCSLTRRRTTTSVRRPALFYAEAITWRPDPDDACWDRLRSQLSEAEILEQDHRQNLLSMMPLASIPPCSADRTAAAASGDP